MTWYTRGSDDFNRTANLNGSALDNYNGGYGADTWSVVSGTWATVQTPADACKNTDVGAVHFALIGSAPDVQECRFSTVFGSGDSGITICTNSDGSHAYMAYYDGTKVYLYKDGTAHGNANISITDVIRIWLEDTHDGNVTLRIDQNGTNIIGWVDSSPLAAGKPGLRAGGGGTSLWNNVLYEVLTAPPSTNTALAASCLA